MPYTENMNERTKMIVCTSESKGFIKRLTRNLWSKMNKSDREECKQIEIQLENMLVEINNNNKKK